MDSSDQEIAALASKLNTLASALGGDSDQHIKRAHKQQLIIEAKNLIWKCQDPVSAVIEQVASAYTAGAISALMEIGVFDAVPPTGTATIEEIAETCAAEQELIIRLMRQVTVSNIFDELKVHEWAHNKFSLAFSEHHGIVGKYIYLVGLQEMYPSMHNLYQYVQKFGKKDINTYTDTPYSWENGMLGKNMWEVLDAHPARQNRFYQGLAIFNAAHPVAVLFPWEEKLRPANTSTRTLIVDVAGAKGHALLAVRAAHPTLAGEMVLQDRQVVLDSIPAGSLPDVTLMAHDMFTPQPVPHAQVYYLRRVLHDWLDADCARIFAAIRPVMAPDSRIIVSDMLIPEPATTADSAAVWLDLMMMTIGGKERTRRDWERLAGLAGLKLVKIWSEPEKYGTLCCVEFMLPDAEPETKTGAK